MNFRCFILFILMSAVLANAGHSAKSVQFGSFTPEQFQDYWYNHGAEISRFSLQQLRYGEIHDGDESSRRARFERLGLPLDETVKGIPLPAEYGAFDRNPTRKRGKTLRPR